MGRASRRKKERRKTPVQDAFTVVRDTSQIQSIEELREEEGPTKVLVRGLYLPPKTYSMHESRIKFAIEAAKRRWMDEFKAEHGPRATILDIQVLEAPSQNPMELMKTEMKQNLKSRFGGTVTGRRWGRTKVSEELAQEEMDGPT